MNRFSALEAVSVAVDRVAREPFGDRGLTWRRSWTVHFTDGDEFEMPRRNESRPESQELADRVAGAILVRLQVKG